MYVCALPDVSPLPASTVPAPADHCAVEALEAYQTTDNTPRKPVSAAEVMSSINHSMKTCLCILWVN